MRAVISVVGKDHPGILAFVASKCAEKEIRLIYNRVVDKWLIYA